MKKKEIVTKNKFSLKENKKMVIFYIAIALFLILTVLIKLGIISSIDNYIESFVIGIRNDKLTNIMINITNLSRAYFLIAISIILLFIFKDKKKALLIIINLICVFSCSQILKYIFKRARPDGEFLVSAYGYSYPSGHAMVSMAYFGFLLYIINKKITNKLSRILLTITTCIIIFLIGFSSIYLGVHYVSDVLGGFIISSAYLIIFLTIINKEDDKE